MRDVCANCGGELGEFDNPPFGPARHFICPTDNKENEK